VHGRLAQQVGREGAGEQAGEGAVQHAEPAGQRAEGGQHQAHAVGGEAAPDRAPALDHHGGLGVQVPGHLARQRTRLGLVAEGERAEAQLRQRAAAERGRRAAVVVALDPDPVPAALQGVEPRPLLGPEPRRPVGIVEAVAEADHRRRRPPRQRRLQRRQDRGGIVGRQEDAAPGVGGGLLEMQVGDDERRPLGPPQRARRLRNKPGPVHQHGPPLIPARPAALVQSSGRHIRQAARFERRARDRATGGRHRP
jgi:hypothetical protein